MSGTKEVETVHTTVEFPKSLWTDWKDTVPRSITLEDRLEALVAADRLGMVETSDIDDDHDAAMTALIQIRRHAMRASQQLGQDEEQAREEIRAVKRAAQNVL